MTKNYFSHAKKMKRSFFIFISLLIVSGLLLLTIIFPFSGSPKKAISNQSNSNSHFTKIKVLSTTSIINDLVQQIGGEFVEAISLMGADIDPHIYRASEGDVKKIATADIIFYNGLYLEAKLTDLLIKIGKQKPVFAVSKLIDKEKLINYSDRYVDPHIWFDLELWNKAGQLVHDQLIKQIPEKKLEIGQNYLKFSRTLEELDLTIKKQIATIPPKKRILITAHDAFSYFGRRYGLKIEGIKGISTASKTGIKDIQRVTDLIVENKIPTVFFEATTSSKDLQAVIEAANFKGQKVKVGGVLLTDALSEPGEKGDSYIGMIVYNTTLIINGLSSPSQSLFFY